MTARWRVAIGVLVAALALRVVYGPPRLGYDAWFALSWGRDIAHGHNPGFSGPMAPTPHPLANLVSAVLSVFGSGGVTAVAAISLVSFAALGLAAFSLTQRLFGAAAGALVALIVLTRPLFVDETLYCSVDIPFLALVTAAGAQLAAARRREGLALVLLVLAGLLRPEGWLLALAVAAWCWWQQTGPDRRWLMAGAVAAPLVWALFDLVVTGDALHSLHGTRDLAQEFGRPRSASTAVTAIPRYVRALLGDSIAWAGAISALAALWLALERAAIPLLVTAIGLFGFLVLGVADLPLLYRYAMLPSIAMVVLIGFGASAWSSIEVSGPARWALGAMAVVVGVLVINSAGDDRDAIRATTANSRVMHAAQADLARLARAPVVKAALKRCPAIAVPSPRVVPELAYRLGRGARDVVVVTRDAPLRATAFSPRAGRVAAGYTLTPRDRQTLTANQVSSLTFAARNVSWSVYAC